MAAEGVVAKPLYLPSELVWLVERYQKNRKLPSFNAAVRELVETHPEIALLLERVYAGSQVKASKEGHPE